MKRFEILKQVADKQITLKAASFLLEVSYRHSIRLLKKLKEEGLNGLIKKYNNKHKNKKVHDFLSKQIIQLKQDIYFDFNLHHFHDKLILDHNIKLSIETIRQLLIKNQLHHPKKRRKIYRRRRRMPKAGLMVQMDSSHHHWIKHVKTKWYLIAAIDDATNEVAVAEFGPHDTTYANMAIIRRLIEKRGVFEALYVDKASHFVTVRHKGLHQDIEDQHKETNIQQALKDLNISLITANSPQAKGRIERLFRFFQDRLIKELRIKGILSYKKANEFLRNDFLPWYNKNYTHKAKSIYKALPENIDLNKIFTIREWRKVNKDNTITFNNEIIQLPPNKMTLSYIKAWVEIRVQEDQKAYVFYKSKCIYQTKLKKPVREIDLEKRERVLSKKIIA
ncbi:MAG: ISNCY family transposase [Nanoarchaeota archaeon]|nr:ISNCY family transposase [Nanoarchaeota archaeon]